MRYELLVLMADFYCLPTAIRLLVPVRYFLAVLGIKCLLWFHSLLMSVRYTLYRIAFNSSIER